MCCGRDNIAVIYDNTCDSDLTPDIIKNNPVVSKIFMGIRPAVVALIIAPVITSAKAAKIGWKTVWIPVAVALLIWSGWAYLSNPILYIVIGGAAGYLWYSRRIHDSRKHQEGGES